MSDLSNICALTLAALEKKYSRTVFELWFKDLTLLSIDDTMAVFGINNEFKRGILEDKYTSVVSDAFAEAIGFPLNIVFKYVPNSDPGKIQIPRFSAVEAEERRRIEEERKAEEKKNEVARQIESRSLVSEYTFENFVVGDSNRFAHAACQAVAKQLSSAYNPLFIYGPSGLGKTHLLYAITNEIKKSRPEVKIIYKKGEDFTNELIASISAGSPSSFRNRYRSADVLLIDDIQFIAGKESTQEEFFHTFNALYDDEKQIILTSDRPPKDIKTLEDRLRTRFEWGLTADIQPPNLELRTAIIKRKAKSLDLELGQDIVDFLAEKLQNNIRQIEGAIKKIAAVSLLTSTPVSREMAQRAISDLLSGSVPAEVTVDRIFNIVSKKYGVSIEDIKGKKRNDNIALPRHVCIFLIRNQTEMSLDAIGKLFCRDHTTVIASIKKAESLIESDSRFAADIAQMTDQIKN